MKKSNILENKWVMIICFTLPALFITLFLMKNDTDLWYLLTEGREIVTNGLYTIDPLSMHEGLHVVVQNWASAALFYLIYSVFSTQGLFIFILLCNLAICIIFYKICMLISDNQKLLSLILMIGFDICLSMVFIVTRPQVISYILLLTTIYLLELYIKNKNVKYLRFLPLISFVQINLHASLWWMMFLFILPYIIDGLKIKIIRTEGYKIWPIIKYTLLAMVAGLINPYTYKAILFIFTSFGDKYMHLYINELHPFSFNRSLCYYMFIIILGIFIIYALYREGKTRLRYVCLMCGTLILSMMSIKGFSDFLLVSIFPLAYLLKDIFIKDIKFKNKKLNKLLYTTVTVVGVLIIPITCGVFIKNANKVNLINKSDEAIEVLKKYDKETSTVYIAFVYGGCVEYAGYKAYIDPRAEVFLKVNNKKADIFEENYKLQNEMIDYKEFIKKYNFTHLLLSKKDKLYDKEFENYTLDFEDGYFRLYTRNDIIKKQKNLT